MQRIEIMTTAGTFEALATGPAQGEPVLLLHGFPQLGIEWEHQLQQLGASGYRAVAPDQRGYSPGVRPSSIKDYGIDELVGDVICIADSLGWDHFHLVGHDWGAVVAWAAADKHADRIKTLTAVSVPHPAAFTEALAEDPVQQSMAARLDMFRAPGAEVVLLSEGGAILRRMLGRGVPESKIERYLDQLASPGLLEAALNWYRATRPEQVQAAATTVPTLYVWSTDDIGISRAAAERTAAHVVGPYTFTCYEGVSHWIPEEAAAALTSSLQEHFVKGMDA